MTQNTKFVIGGVDTHKAVHVAVVIDEKGAMLGTGQFATDRAGYRQLRNCLSCDLGGGHTSGPVLVGRRRGSPTGRESLR